MWCRKWDLRIRCRLRPGYSVIRIGERVTTDDQIDWGIVLVHDRFHEDHARMRRVQDLLEFDAGLDDVGLCLFVTREDIWQFRVAPVRDVVVLGVFTQYGSLYCVSRVLLITKMNGVRSCRMTVESSCTVIWSDPSPVSKM